MTASGITNAFNKIGELPVVSNEHTKFVRERFLRGSLVI